MVANVAGTTETGIKRRLHQIRLHGIVCSRPRLFFGFHLRKPISGTVKSAVREIAAAANLLSESDVAQILGNVVKSVIVIDLAVRAGETRLIRTECVALVCAMQATLDTSSGVGDCV